jgi:hypothetical protein
MRGLFLAIAVLLLASCNDKTPEEVKAKKFEFEGHSYIEFYRYDMHVNYTGFVHDPDCQCMIEYD